MLVERERFLSSRRIENEKWNLISVRFWQSSIVSQVNDDDLARDCNYKKFSYHCCVVYNMMNTMVKWQTVQ